MERPLTAEYFSEMAMDFCSRNSFDKPPQAPRSGGGAVAGAAATAAAQRPANKRPMHEFMSEEEQLEAAMKASLQEAATAASDDNNDDDGVEYIGDDDDDEDNTGKEKSVAQEEKKSSSVIMNNNDVLVGMLIGDEPAEGGARIQVRMPDGKRIVRKFANSDHVRTIYAFVAVRTSACSREVCGTNGPSVSVFWSMLLALLLFVGAQNDYLISIRSRKSNSPHVRTQQSSDEARAGKAFVLMAGFPPTDMVSSIDATIAVCNLAGQAVSVRWKD
jgi:hypothetical protein